MNPHSVAQIISEITFSMLSFFAYIAAYHTTTVDLEPTNPFDVMLLVAFNSPKYPTIAKYGDLAYVFVFFYSIEWDVLTGRRRLFLA